MPRITTQEQPDPALRSDMSRGTGENEREGSTPGSLRALGGEGEDGGGRNSAVTHNGSEMARCG